MGPLQGSRVKIRGHITTHRTPSAPGLQHVHNTAIHKHYRDLIYAAACGLTGCCCYRVHPLWAAIVGQPRNSIIICRVQLGQAISQLHQQTATDDVRHRLCLSTGTQVRVGLSPSLAAGTAMTLRSEETIQERPLSSRGVKTWLLDCEVDH